MLKFFAKIFGFVLNYIYGIIGNYGIAIIIFTIALKLILMPINIKQQKTMKKNAKVQEKIKEIQDKYASDPTRMNQEMMNVYKQENMSPFSGCLGSIFSFIVILSMFYLVSRPLTYMLKVDNQVIDNYVTQIQTESEDKSSTRYPEIAVIKNFGDKDENVKINMNFLGLDLSDVPTNDYTNWKVFIIPVLYVITSLISMKLNTAFNVPKKENDDKSKNIKTNLPKKVENGDDPTEMMNQMTKNMNLFMPLMTVSIALIAPLGLALYWFISNVFSILERLVIFKFFKSEEE